MVQKIITTELALFEVNSLKYLNAEIKKRGFQRILVISDTENPALLKKISASLAENKITYSIFDRTGKTASLSDTRAAAKVGESLRADAVISIGSKAVSDVSKAVSVLLSNPQIQDARKLSEATKSKNTPLPLLMFFSSIGNARDSSQVIVLEDEVNRKKLYFSDINACPLAVFFDASFIKVSKDLGVSIASLTASAIESLVSKDAWTMTDIASIQALRLIADNASSALRGNVNALEAIFEAQHLAGIAAVNSSLALGTAMADTLEAFAGFPSDWAQAILLPEIMRYNAIVSKSSYRDIALAFGAKLSSTSKPEAYRKSAVSAIEKFLKSLSLSKKGPTLSLSKEDAIALQDAVLKNKNADTNPKPASKKKIVDLLKLLD